MAGAGGRTPVMEATAGRHANVVAILLAAAALPIEPFAGRRQIASRGHRGPITAAASVDGTLFASDINSECLRVWGLSDAGQLEPIAELFAYDRLHRRTIVRCVLPLLCGALVAGCNDGSLLVWPDAASVGPRMVSPRILTGHRSTAWSLCALPALLPKGASLRARRSTAPCVCGTRGAQQQQRRSPCSRGTPTTRSPWRRRATDCWHPARATTRYGCGTFQPWQRVVPRAACKSSLGTRAGSRLL